MKKYVEYIKKNKLKILGYSMQVIGALMALCTAVPLTIKYWNYSDVYLLLNHTIEVVEPVMGLVIYCIGLFITKKQ